MSVVGSVCSVVRQAGWVEGDCIVWEGRKGGRKEGRKEGREKERKEGRKKGRKEGRKKGTHPTRVRRTGVLREGVLVPWWRG